MKTPTVSMIAAIDRNRVLGYKGKIPWNIPEDIKRFREITRGHVIIMGRKTYESIGHPLPQRTNIVVTRDKSFKAEGCIVVDSVEGALEVAREHERPSTDEAEIFVIGGGQIYETALPYANKLYLTLVDGEYQGDAYFPAYHEFKKEVFREDHVSSSGVHFTYVDLMR